MKSSALLGAALGGALGSLLWAGIAYAFELEVGYVAWILGGLVGFGSVLLGGRGPANATACAAVALVAILAGKALAVNLFLENAMARQIYDQLMPQAQAFAALETEAEYPAFMVEHGYTAAAHADAVPPAEVQLFTSTAAPLLGTFAAGEVSFDQWRERPEVETSISTAMAQVPTLSIVFESLDLFDIVFALLGVATAYRVGLAAGTPLEPSSVPAHDQSVRDRLHARERKEEEALVS